MNIHASYLKYFPLTEKDSQIELGPYISETSFYTEEGRACFLNRTMPDEPFVSFSIMPENSFKKEPVRVCLILKHFSIL